jgi:hypothetical protein
MTPPWWPPSAEASAMPAWRSSGCVWRPRPVQRAARRAADAGALASSPEASVLAAGGIPRRAGAAHLQGGTRRRGLPAALADKLDPSDPGQRRRYRRRLLDQVGIELIGTRTLAEIAQRLLAEVADARETPLAKAMRR